MSIDLGDNPQGTPPDAAQQGNIRSALGINGAFIDQELDYAIGNSWKVGLPAIFGQEYDPALELVPIYESPLQITLYDINIENWEYYTLQYAGDLNGKPHYTYSGSPMDFDPYYPPSMSPAYSSLFFDPSFQYYRLLIYTEFEQEHVYVYQGNVDFSVAVQDVGTWIPYNATSYAIQSLTLDSGILNPIINGRIYRSGQGNNVFFANYNPIAGAWEWMHVVGYNGEAGAPSINLAYAEAGSLQPSVISGFLDYDKGGTNANTQQKAVQNTSAWVTSVTTNSTLNGNNSGTTIVVNSASNVTLTIALNLPVNTTFKVINRGTGQVNIVGATGVTLLGNFVSGTPNKSGISVKFDVATITQVASNTYVLSDNFKAAAF